MLTQYSLKDRKENDGQYGTDGQCHNPGNKDLSNDLEIDSTNTSSDTYA